MQNTVELGPPPPAIETIDPQGAFALRVQRALDEILKSSHFRTSKQSQHLLQYIVRQSLEGHVESLKERVIGVEVFGRPLDYDTNADPIVRSRAAEVRKKLAQYYVEEGGDSSVRIKFNPGSYLATFTDVAKPNPEEIGSSSTTLVEPLATPEIIPGTGSPEHSPTLTRRRQGLLRLGFQIVGVVLVLSCLAIAGYRLRPKDPLAQFWSPILTNSSPVLIYTGSNPVYMPSNQLIERFRATHQISDLDAAGYEFLIPLSEDQKFGAGDLIPVKGLMVTLGDVSANVDVTSMLTRFKHPFDLRSGEDVAFGDIRESPAILIGAFNNAWTLQMTGDFPFVFGSGLTIREQGKNARQWSPVLSSDNKLEVDYALVARLPHSKTGEPLITIAGIEQSGTRAAAEFITSPQYIDDLIRAAPNDWMNKNLEFVLQTKVVNDIPTTPTLVAVRAW
jgi:hypothetical protein